MAEIVIRSGQVQDIPALEPLLIASWVKHAEQEPTLMNPTRMLQSDVREYYREGMANPDTVILVAEMGWEVVGGIRGDMTALPEFFRYINALAIDDVVVREDVQRQGIGRELIRELEKRALSLGAERLIAPRVYTFNSPIQQLLQSEGFTMPHSMWTKVLATSD